MRFLCAGFLMRRERAAERTDIFAEAGSGVGAGLEQQAGLGDTLAFLLH